MLTDQEVNLAILEGLNCLAKSMQRLTRKFNSKTNNFVGTSAKRPVLQRKRKDPNAPRGVRNAYTFFVQKMGKDMRKKNKSINQKHIIAEAGRLWNEMDDEEKAPYTKLFKRDKERYLEELKVYKLQKQEAESQQREEEQSETEEESEDESEVGSEEESEMEAVQSPNKNGRAANRSPSKRPSREDEDHDSVDNHDDEDDQDDRDDQDQDELGEDELDEEEEEKDLQQRLHSDSDDEGLLHGSHDENTDDVYDEEVSNNPIKTSSAKEEATKEKATKASGKTLADDRSSQKTSDKSSDIVEEEEGSPINMHNNDNDTEEELLSDQASGKGSDSEEEAKENGKGEEPSANGNDKVTDLDKATSTTSATNGKVQEPEKKSKKRKLRNKHKNKKHQSKKHKPETAWSLVSSSSST